VIRFEGTRAVPYTPISIAIHREKRRVFIILHSFMWENFPHALYAAKMSQFKTGKPRDRLQPPASHRERRHAIKRPSTSICTCVTTSPMANWGPTTCGFQDIKPITGGEADHYPAWTSRLLELPPFELGFLPTRVDYLRHTAVNASGKSHKKKTFPSVCQIRV
jgi:hypothetical protein